MNGKVRPIPKYLLNSGATLLVPSARRVGIYEQGYDETELSSVRIDMFNKIKLSKDNAAAEKSGTLFYDCRYSRPENVIFTTEMRLRINGAVYRITEVRVLLDGAGIHHYEAVFR